MVSSHAVPEMRRAILELIINRSRRVATLTTGELCDTETVTRSSKWGVGKVPMHIGNSLAAHATARYIGDALVMLAVLFSIWSEGEPWRLVAVDVRY